MKHLNSMTDDNLIIVCIEQPSFNNCLTYFLECLDAAL